MVAALLWCLAAWAGEGRYFAYVTDYPPVYDLQGFAFLSRLEVFRPFEGETKEFSFPRPEGRYTLRWQAKQATIELAREARALIQIPVAPVLTQAEAYLHAHPDRSPRALPQAVLTLEKETAEVRVRVVLDDFSARECTPSPCVYHFKADVLVAPKSSPTGSKR